MFEEITHNPAIKCMSAIDRLPDEFLEWLYEKTQEEKNKSREVLADNLNEVNV
jgi:hypothetical protein